MFVVVVWAYKVLQTIQMHVVYIVAFDTVYNE